MNSVNFENLNIFSQKIVIFATMSSAKILGIQKLFFFFSKIPRTKISINKI